MLNSASNLIFFTNSQTLFFMSSQNHKIIIIGGGIIGLSALWFLRNFNEEKEILLVEKNTIGSGCSEKAAGMLAPVNELEFDETNILYAGLEALKLYEEWNKHLPIPLGKKGSYEIAYNSDDVAYLKRRFDFQKSLNLNVHWIEKPANVLDIPLNPDMKAAIYAPEETQMDAQKFLKILKQNLTENIRENTELLHFSYDAASKKFLLTFKDSLKGTSFEAKAEILILATGVYGRKEWNLPMKIIPVKGQIVGVKQIPEVLDFKQHIIRLFSKELGKGYFVGKNNRIILGTTSEMKGLDETQTVGGIFSVLRRAYFSVPALYELPIIKINTGLRPATKSFLPVIDKLPDKPLYLMNGFYRHGILLAPLAGLAISEMLAGKKVPDCVKAWTL